VFLRSKDLPLETGGVAISELKHLIGRPDATILEIGTNVGQTTEEFLREMPGARIFCFEPEPRAIGQFRSRIKSPNVILFECAVEGRSRAKSGRNSCYPRLLRIGARRPESALARAS
jgi:hypothetical protein